MKELFESGTDVFLIPADMAQDGKISKVLLPIICSQANTEGGIVLIGAAREADSSVVAEGLPSISETQLLVNKLISDKSKISVNTIKSVNVIQENGKDVLKIEVAPAPWTERPVYINSNPMHSVYRYFEGENVIFRKKFVTLMAKDSVDIQRDNKRFDHFHESTIDIKALERYRKIHEEKRPVPKWDLLDNYSYMERISAKSEGKLLKAGLLMFGENKNVSFCLRRLNDGGMDTFEAKNIWSFIELVIPIFGRCDDIKCRQALLEAFFNSLIHADYSNGNVEVVEEKDNITFINSGIPRSSDNSSLCRNTRIMRMLCFVGYANNKGLGLELIRNYSSNSRLSVNYEKWQTEITIPINASVKTQAEETAKISSRVPAEFYPVVELAKQNEVEFEVEVEEIMEPTVIGMEIDKEVKEADVIENAKDIEDADKVEVVEKTEVVEDIEENIEDNMEVGVIEEIEEIEWVEAEEDNNVVLNIPDYPYTENQPGQIISEQQGVSFDLIKESEQGKILEQAVKEYRLKSAFFEHKEENNTANLFEDLDKDIKEDLDKDLKEDSDKGDKAINSQVEAQTFGINEKKKKIRPKPGKPRTLSVVMGNLITIEEETKEVEFSDRIMMVRENSHASSDTLKDALLEYCIEFRTIQEISAALLRPESSVKRHINKMVKEGKLEENENKEYKKTGNSV